MQEPRDGLDAAAHAVGLGQPYHRLRRDLQARPPQGRLAGLGPPVRRVGDAQDGGAAPPQAAQVACDEIALRPRRAGDPGQPRGAVVGDEDDGVVGVPVRLRGRVRAARDEHEGVAPAAPRALEEGQLGAPLPPGQLEDDRRRLGGPHELGRQERVGGLLQGRHGQRDGLVPARAQGRGPRVDAVPELSHRGQDALAGRLRGAARPAHDVGDRLGRHAGQVRDLLHGHLGRHGASPPMVESRGSRATPSTRVRAGASASSIRAASRSTASSA